MTRTVLKILAVAVLLVLPALSYAITSDYKQVDYARDVQFLTANPSPNAAVSNINDYTQQPEQLNLFPTDGNVRVLRTDQKVLLNHFVSAIFPLDHANPRELRGPIRTVVRKEGGEADVIQDFKSKKNYLQVTCPDFQLPYIEAAMKALDQDWTKEKLSGSAEIYVPMRFRDVDKVLNITRFYVSPMFEFHVDKVNNALYYSDEPALMGLQRRGIKEVDIPPNQMMLDVAIYEVSLNNNLLLGTDFLSWKNGPGRNLFEAATGYAREVISTKLPTGNSDVTNERQPFLYGSYNAVLMSAFVDFLRVKGKARLLNQTQMTAKSGSIGTISAVDEVVTFKRFLTPPPPAPNPPDRVLPVVPPPGEEPIDDGIPSTLPGYRQRSLDYAKSGVVGVQVQILPVVGQKSSEVSVSIDVSDMTGVTPAGTPIIKSRSVDSKIRMYPGEPYVIAGLDRKGEVSSVGKVPILGSIPVLGWLFGHETESVSQTQIVVILTPSVTLNAESVIEMPQKAKTTVAIINEGKKADLPKAKFGFDQWLLDTE